MVEFEIDGITYRAQKLDAVAQFHLSRKIGPIIPKLVPIFVELSKGTDLKNDLAMLGAVLAPFADALAAMSNADAEFVLGTCLSAVQRKQGDSYAAVWNTSAKTLMFSDMDLGTMLPLVVRVIRENLGNFIAGLLSSQSEQPAGLTSNT